MSYKVNQKVIIYNDLFKIKKVENENVYFGCNEKGCSAIIMEPNIKLTYIGEADPEYYHNAKNLFESAKALKNSLSEEDLCKVNACDELDNAIKAAETLMKRFKYNK